MRLMGAALTDLGDRFRLVANVIDTLVDIAEDTRIAGFRKEVRWNQAYYHLARGV
jgi:L-arabinose isomerase